MTNIMIDIETLSTNQDALIVSIGAVKFTQNGLGNEFYRVCYHQQKDRDIQMNTVKWWMKQSDEARQVFNDDNVVSLREALVDFKDFIDRDNDIIWANGVNFDVGILENAFREARLKFPWKYTNIRCLRSIRGIYPEYNEIMSKYRDSASHNAIDDAKCQARTLIELRDLKGFNL